MLGDDDEASAAASSFMGLLVVEMTSPLSSIVFLCSVTIVVDRPSGYPPSAGTTCVPIVRAYSRTEMVPKDIDLEDNDDDVGLVGVDCIDIEFSSAAVDLPLALSTLLQLLTLVFAVSIVSI